jgi:hypothetical protein
MLTDVSEMRTVSIIRALRTSETSVNIKLTTRQYIPEDSKLQILTRYETDFGLGLELGPLL